MLEQLKASAGAGKTYALTRRFLALLLLAGEPGPAGVCLSGGAARRTAQTGDGEEPPFAGSATQGEAISRLRDDAPESLGAAIFDRPDQARGRDREDGPEAAQDYGWTDILAVTFTNKAAAEMKERVVRALKERALGLDDGGPAADWSPAKARQALETILRHYRQLNIRTIDSLLHMLMRLFALELGLSPDFEVLFDEEKLFEPLYDRFLDRCEHGSDREREIMDACVDSLLRLSGAEGFWLRGRLRDRMLDAFKLRLRSDAPFETDASILLGRLALRHDAVRQAARELRGRLTDGGLDLLKHFENFLANCQGDDPRSVKLDSAYASKETLAECLKKGCHKKIASDHEACFETLRTSLGEFRRARAVYHGAARLAPFLAAADLLLEELGDVERSSGLILAGGLPGRVAVLLGDDMAAPDAFCRFGARLAHMLVDEFQDTSRGQWSALAPLAEECLAKGGGLCLVGDVKQAIYGWRGGDFRLFDEVIEDGSLPLLAPGVRRDSLPANWRSAPRVVRFNNAVFGRLEDLEFAVSLACDLLGDCPPEAAARLGRHLARAFAGCRQEICDRNLSMPGRTRVERLRGADKESLVEETRQALIRLLQDDLLLRRGCSEIAILTRSNTEAGLVAKWLLTAGLPVVTESSLLLAAHPLVRQLTAFLAFIDYPADGLAFWEFVTGEELFLGGCGLARDAMDAWLAAQDKGPLFLRFREDFPEVWRLRVEPFVRQAGLLGPYDLTREVVRLYRVLERRPDDAIFVWRFLEVLHASEEKGCVSLASFLDLWRRAGTEEKIPLPESVAAVRVMTMHKAKGLEFPAVIIPFHDWSGSAGDEPVEWEEDGLRLLTPLVKDLGGPYWERLSLSLLEQLNLLYVAWTRAVSELHVFLPGEGRARTGPPVMRAIERLLPEAGVDGDAWLHDEGEIEAPIAPAIEERPPVMDDSGRSPGGLRLVARKNASAQADHDDAAASPPPESPTASGGVAPAGSTIGGMAIAGAIAGKLSSPDAGPDDATVLIDATAAPEPTLADGAPAQDAAPRLMDWLPRLKIARNFNLDFLGQGEDRAARRGAVTHRAFELLRLTGDDVSDVRRAALAALFEENVDPLDPPVTEDEMIRLLGWAVARPELRPLLAVGRAEVGLLADDGKLRRADFAAWLDGEIVVVEYKTGREEEAHHRQLRDYLRLLGGGPASDRRCRGLLVYLDQKRIEHVVLA